KPFSKQRKIFYQCGSQIWILKLQRKLMMHLSNEQSMAYMGIRSLMIRLETSLKTGYKKNMTGQLIRIGYHSVRASSQVYISLFKRLLKKTVKFYYKHQCTRHFLILFEMAIEKSWKIRSYLTETIMKLILKSLRKN